MLFVPSEYQLVKIYLSDIEFIESLEDYLKIHVGDDKSVMTLMMMKAMLEKLPSDRFRRIHRSYIVPLAKIKSISNKKVRLSNIELPIGDSYFGVLQDWIKK